jgi:hypothetical protein
LGQGITAGGNLDNPNPPEHPLPDPTGPPSPFARMARASRNPVIPSIVIDGVEGSVISKPPGYRKDRFFDKLRMTFGRKRARRYSSPLVTKEEELR